MTTNGIPCVKCGDEPQYINANREDWCSLCYDCQLEAVVALLRARGRGQRLEEWPTGTLSRLSPYHPEAPREIRRASQRKIEKDE